MRPSCRAMASTGHSCMKYNTDTVRYGSARPSMHSRARPASARVSHSASRLGAFCAAASAGAVSPGPRSRPCGGCRRFSDDPLPCSPQCGTARAFPRPADSFPYADRPRQTSPAKDPRPADGRAPAGSTPYIPAFHIAVPSLQTPVPSLETPPAFLPRPARRAACLQRVLV